MIFLCKLHAMWTTVETYFCYQMRLLFCDIMIRIVRQLALYELWIKSEIVGKLTEMGFFQASTTSLKSLDRTETKYRFFFSFSPLLTLHMSAFPMNALPCLEVDGKRVNSSLACCRYIAKEVGLAGSDDWENLQIDTIADTVNDFRLSERENCDRLNLI